MIAVGRSGIVRRCRPSSVVCHSLSRLRLAREIVEDLRAALEEFAAIAEDLGAGDAA
jgi:hypothetical protein